MSEAMAQTLEASDEVCLSRAFSHVGRHTQNQKEALHTHALARRPRNWSDRTIISISTRSSHWPRHDPTSKVAGHHSLSGIRPCLRSVSLYTQFQPTDMSYISSLSKGKGVGPENPSSNYRARTFCILLFIYSTFTARSPTRNRQSRRDPLHQECHRSNKGHNTDQCLRLRLHPHALQGRARKRKRERQGPRRQRSAKDNGEDARTRKIPRGATRGSAVGKR